MASMSASGSAPRACLLTGLYQMNHRAVQNTVPLDARHFTLARALRAIGYDPVRNRIAIWEKRGGARLVDPSGVAAWHSGMLLTIVLNRTTATPMIQLYARKTDTKPFFKVGVVKETDAAAWRDRLQAAFGIEKGARVMLSTPPATTTLRSPARIARAAYCTASSPEPHSRFTVTPDTDCGKPARSRPMRATLRLSSPA